MEKRTIKELSAKLRGANSKTGSSRALLYICAKPIPKILITYGKDQPRRFKRGLSSYKYASDLDYFSALSRAYFRVHKCSWFEGLSDLIAECGADPDAEKVMSVAHALIINSMLEDGYVLVHESTFSSTLIQNIPLSANTTCVVQYVLICNTDTGTLCSELWVEPDLQITDSGEFEEVFQSFKQSLHERDQNITGYLFTFLVLKLLSADDVKSYGAVRNSTVDLDCKFSLNLVLEESGSFQGIGYRLKSFSGDSKFTTNDSPPYQDFLEESHTLFNEEGEANGHYVFYKFLEQCLANICDGKLSTSEMNQPRETKDFLSKIKPVLEENLEISGSIIFSSIDDSICFVKRLGEGLLLLFLPRFENVSAQDLICLSIFECATPSENSPLHSKEDWSRPTISAVDSSEYFVNATPIFSRGEFSFGLEFLESKLSSAYFSAYAKGFYFSLLTSKSEAESTKLDNASDILDAAEKSFLDIDVTQYISLNSSLRAKGIRWYILLGNMQ